MTNSTEAVVTPLRPTTKPPVFVVTDRDGVLPPGQFLIRILDGAVVLAHRDNPWDSWGRPVKAEVAS